MEVGKAVRVRPGEDATFLALGAMVEHAVDAADILSQQGLDVAVYSARFVKPLDETLVAQLIVAGRPVLTVEDHSAAGGFGSAVLEAAARLNNHSGAMPTPSLPFGVGMSTVDENMPSQTETARRHGTIIQVLGLPDRFIPHANRSQQLAAAGLSPQALAEAMRRTIANRPAMHAK
jgi:1-deoxy-D-xylulose-5-phosphate synthase